MPPVTLGRPGRRGAPRWAIAERRPLWQMNATGGRSELAEALLELAERQVARSRCEAPRPL